jgi:hypothetical protein
VGCLILMMGFSSRGGGFAYRSFVKSALQDRPVCLNLRNLPRS